MVTLYFNEFPLFVYATIAVQFGYRTGDALESEEEFIQVVDSNASYYRLLVQAKQRAPN